MILKTAFTALMGVALLAGASAAAESYGAGEYFSLGLAQAVLSPKPLGPPAQFRPMPVQAKAEPLQAEPARAEVKHVRTVKVTREHFAKRTPARTRLAHRHADPLDAQAFDARIQVWPCKSGGICNWRPARK